MKYFDGHDGKGFLRRAVSVLMSLVLMTACAGAAFADQSRKNAVGELYSADGYYEDGLKNGYSYSYHVPQIQDATAAAGEINAEIAGKYGKTAESEFGYMEKGTSLTCSEISWEAYWSGDWLFLLVTEPEVGDLMEYDAYGYDFGTGTRVTNEMILAQRGISGEEYLKNLEEKTTFMLEDLFGGVAEKHPEVYENMLETTRGWLSMERPMFINRFGEIVTVVKLCTVAGSGYQNVLVTPFVYG